MPVRSHKNRRVVEAARLHRARERRDRGQTLIEGPHLLEEALAAGVIPVELFALESDEPTRELAASRHIDLVVVDDLGLARVAGTKSPRGPVASIEIPDRAPSEMRPAWWCPGGSVIREMSAPSSGRLPHSAGPSPTPRTRQIPGPQRCCVPEPGLISEPGCCPSSRWPNSTAWDTSRWPRWSTVGWPPSALVAGRYAVLIGDESSGLPDTVSAAAAFRITIPMPGGIESLNAATAAAIIVYELSKYQVPSTGERQRPL